MSGNNTGDWDWTQSRMSGYSYPTESHLITPAHRAPSKTAATWPVHRRPRRDLVGFKTVVAAAVTSIIGLSAIAMLTAPTGPNGPVALSQATVTTMASAAPISSPAAIGGWPGMFTAPTNTIPINPYSDTGDWLVGPDLPAGRYRVVVTGELGGYWARCTNTACNLGDGHTGLIDNALLDYGAPESVLIIRPSDYLVKTAGVRLIPA